MSKRENRPYPWQAPLWQGLIERQRTGILPHALLFCGPEGMGKGHLARVLAQALLCKDPQEDGTACGRCRSCQLFYAGSHPDFLWLEPEEEGKDLSVDQIRALSASQALKGQYSQRKVVILQPADSMNIHAANAFLKTLEEPSPGTLLILCTSRESALLPTIRSRCQVVAFRPLADQKPAVREWLRSHLSSGQDPDFLLALSGGAPLAALALAEAGGLETRQGLFADFEQLADDQADPVEVATRGLEQGLKLVLDHLYGWVADMIRLNSIDTPHLTNPDLGQRLQALAKRVDLADLYRLLEQVQEALRLARGQSSPQLLLENVLIAWTQIPRRSQETRAINV